jgi:hypothetical protein
MAVIPRADRYGARMLKARYVAFPRTADAAIWDIPRNLPERPSEVIYVNLVSGWLVVARNRDKKTIGREIMESFVHSIHSKSTVRTRRQFNVPQNLRHELTNLGASRFIGGTELYTLPVFQRWTMYRQSLLVYTRTMFSSICFSC